MQPILVPTDFSRNANTALDVAYQIALRTKSEIVLLNVCQTNDYADTTLGIGFDKSIAQDYVDKVQKSVGDALKDITAQEKYAGVVIHAAIEFGNLSSQIATTAERIDAQLIVMGTKGAHGVSEMLIGSNTERVIRTAACPVLTVPSNTTNFGVKTVALPTTLDANQAVVFKELAKWQAIFDFQVKLLYISNPQAFASVVNIDGLAKGLANESGLKNYELFNSPALDEGNVIIEFAQQQQADMIVMGTNQRTGIAHFFLGSITEDVANHTTMPVLSISLRKK